MPWWFWLGFLVVASVGAVYLARRIAPMPPEKPEPVPVGPVFSPDGPDGFLVDMPEDRTRCPFCLDKPLPPPLTGKELAGYTASLKRVAALLAAGKYEKALSMLDTLIPLAPLEDHLRLLTAVYDVFEGLCENLGPAEVLALYDRLVAAGGALAFALAHEQEGELAMILGYSFSRYPQAQTERELCAMMDFLRLGHPLLVALQHQDPQSITEAINRQAANVLGGWEELTGPPSRAMGRVYAWLDRAK
ncbi:hypothetical protein LJC46_01625 [Desulfovibrio sp. OttesenSCG-928-G15]|nr:hypothetical protein [Desulfovibrio sp. OttesenSCG-928-G15]